MSIEDQIDNLTDDLEDLFQMKVQGKDKHTKALGATLNIGALYTFPFYDKLKFGFLESTRIKAFCFHPHGLTPSSARIGFQKVYSSQPFPK